MEKEVKTEISESQVKDICFIITPIGDEGSVIRKKTDGLIDNVLEPVCNELNMEAIPAHKIDKLGSITNQVVQSVLDSKLVIANLTGLNPNVMYELAIRHAIKKPVVCIAEHGTKLPFDITTERTIFYSDDMYGATRLRSELKDKLQAALADANVDNPIYRAIEENMIIKDLQLSSRDGSSDSLLYILQRLDKIESAIKRQSGSTIKDYHQVYNSTDSLQLYETVITLSKSCSEDIIYDAIKYFDAYIGLNGFIDYKIQDNEIILLTNAMGIPFNLDSFIHMLKDKYKIKLRSIQRRDGV